MKKKTISLILALLMVFSLLPASAFAANTVQSGTCGDNMTWTLDDEGVLTITGTGWMKFHSEDSEEVEDIEYTPWRAYKSLVKSVVIGDGVLNVGGCAFYCFDNLEEVSLPEGIKWIGTEAFFNCTKLTKINLPNGLTDIGSDAFSGCSDLKEITIPDTVVSIDVGAFGGCSSLTKVRVPNGVESIPDDMFGYCTGLTEVILPDSLSSIGDKSFYNCSSLKTINIPNDVKSIGYSAFEGCSALTGTVILDNVEFIGQTAFSGCSALTDVHFGGSLSTIRNGTFSGCSSLESVSFSNSVKSIGQNAFYGCTALKEIYFDGTDMQCAVINVEDGNDALDSVTVYCALDYPFTDIADSGYRDYISLGQAVGIVNGYPDGTFRPSNTVTRAQYITMLYNMYGKPDVSGYSLNFKDKNSISGPYVDAVKWGVALGIINGYGDNTFRPNQEITRAQMAAFSYRLMKLAVGGEFKDEVKTDCGFKDSASIAKDYKEAVNVCANLGIITGFDTDNDGKGDTFRPNATANRGQAATIIVRVAASLGMYS